MSIRIQHTHVVLLLALTLIPTLTFAAPANFGSLVDLFLQIIGVLVALVFALTFIVLVWGIIRTWIIHPGDESELEKGKQIVLWGIIAFVVMTSIWGILTLLKSSIFGP